MMDTTDTTVTTRQQSIGFDADIAHYDERGWSEQPLCLNRQGDTSSPLIINIKCSPPLNENAPGAQLPIYNAAIEMHWKAGESGKKEVPIRIKANSVQIEPLYVVARLEIPLGQDVELEKGCGTLIIRIDNEYTTKSPDRSADFLVSRSSGTINSGRDKSTRNRDPFETSITPFIPPAN